MDGMHRSPYAKGNPILTPVALQRRDFRKLKGGKDGGLAAGRNHRDLCPPNSNNVGQSRQTCRSHRAVRGPQCAGPASHRGCTPAARGMARAHGETVGAKTPCHPLWQRRLRPQLLRARLPFTVRITSGRTHLSHKRSKPTILFTLENIIGCPRTPVVQPPSAAEGPTYIVSSFHRIIVPSSHRSIYRRPPPSSSNHPS